MSGRAGKRPKTPRGLAGPKAEKTISLASQGGGAHGAFTWGVLDYLLEDGRLAFEAVTGASAGSMNAVVLLEGWIRGGPEGAREQLRKFWKRVSLDGVLSPIQRTLFDQFLGFWSAGGTPAHLWLNAWSRAASPYEFNPIDINPLRDALNEIIDFEKVRACTQAKLFVAATNVWNGKIRVFNGPELTVDHVLASACLPKIIPGGGNRGRALLGRRLRRQSAALPALLRDPHRRYRARADQPDRAPRNPAHRARDRQPPHRDHLQRHAFARAARGRVVTRLIDQGKLSRREYKRVNMHRIHGGRRLDEYTASSRLNAEWGFFKELKDLGRATARRWLRENYDSIGERSTLDLQQAYS
jgi:NTE family protein